ncbi:MAG: hypothetical protein IPJ71_12955 [Bdellovibrionales bacterium]|nr:hypothetical protein [Bdellovibrionales bacterium]
MDSQKQKDRSPTSRALPLMFMLVCSCLISPPWQSALAAAGWDDLQISTKWFSTLTESNISYEDLNRGNSFKIPSQILESQLREDVRAYYLNFVVILRPTLSLSRKSQAEGPDLTTKANSTTLMRWNEAFVQWNLSDSFFTVYGIQNFQWGPAESFNPSNGIFRETAQQRTLTHQSRGKHLLRFNYSWTPQINTIFLAELSDNSGDAPFLTDVEFRHKMLQKTELNWNSGSDYVGIVVGGEDSLSPYFGEYFNLSISDGLSLYGDGKHQRGSESWYPTEDANTSLVSLEQTHHGSHELLSSGVLGLRYAFENGSDLRYEMITYSPGYNEQDHLIFLRGLLASSGSQMQRTSTWIHRVDGLGMEFPGQKFSYLSLRAPDFFGVSNWNLMARAIRSHTDLSYQYYLSTDWTMGPAGTWTLAGLFSPSAQNKELGSPAHTTIYFGYEHVW